MSLRPKKMEFNVEELKHLMIKAERLANELNAVIKQIKSFKIQSHH